MSAAGVASCGKLLDRMLRGAGWFAVVFVCGGAFAACATYDGLTSQMDNLGDGGAPGSGATASDGGKSSAGTGADMTSAGKTSVGGQASGGTGGVEVVMEAGAGGVDSSGGSGGGDGGGSGGT